MSPRQPVVFILLDAFRWDYLSPGNTPDLWRLTKEGCHIRQLTPGFGFCEIAEYATGAPPGTTGKFTQLTFGRTRVGAGYQALYRLFDVAEAMCGHYRGRGSTRLTNWVTRDVVRLFADNPSVLDLRYRVPLSLLPLLRMPESARYTDPGALDTESLFDKLRQSGGHIDDESFVIRARVTGSDEDRIDRLIESLDTEQGRTTDLFLIYLGDCDGAGHIEGPDSVKTRAVAGVQSRRVARLTRAFTDRGIRARFVIVGDHGMLPVHSYLDAGRHLRRAAANADLRVHRDYLLFLDSTMVRIWLNSTRAAEVFTDVIRGAPFNQMGDLLTHKAAEALQVPGPGDAYGHLIWLVNPGTMVFPDYFNSEPLKGMHGYLPHLEDQKGMAIIVGDGVLEQAIPHADLIDLCPTVCNLLGIAPPDRCQGRALL